MRRLVSTIAVYFAALSCNAQNNIEVSLSNFSRNVFELGSKNHRLSSILISEILGISLTRQCEGPIPNESGEYYVCTFTPKVEQTGLFKLIKFSSASRRPNPDNGGSITWLVNPKILCLKRSLMSAAFGTHPTFPRYPVISEAFSLNNETGRSGAYDLIISLHKHPEENTFIAINEENGCATQIKLYKNETEE